MLARIRKSMDEKDQGFTLIELLVVMIIIGILAAIAVPVFVNQRKKAVESSMKSDLRTLANQMETYFTDNQLYGAPQGTTGSIKIALATDVVTLSAGNTISLAEGVDGSAKPVVANAAKQYPAAVGYCLTLTNPSAGQSWGYNSTTGGLFAVTATAKCP